MSGDDAGAVHQSTVPQPLLAFAPVFDPARIQDPLCEVCFVPLLTQCVHGTHLRHPSCCVQIESNSDWQRYLERLP